MRIPTELFFAEKNLVKHSSMVIYPGWYGGFQSDRCEHGFQRFKDGLQLLYSKLVPVSSAIPSLSLSLIVPNADT